MEKVILFGFLVLSAIVACHCRVSVTDYRNKGKVAASIKNLIHTKKDSNIKKREKSSGFKFLNIYSRLGISKGISQKHFLKRINRRLLPFVENDARLKGIVKTLLEYISDEVEEHKEQFFTIVSKFGDGRAKALFVYFKQLKSGKYYFKQLRFSGTFKLAATLVITRKRSKGWFSSSSRDVINYLPARGITNQDVQDLLNIIVPQISKVMGEFVPT